MTLELRKARFARSAAETVTTVAAVATVIAVTAVVPVRTQRMKSQNLDTPKTPMADSTQPERELAPPDWLNTAFLQEALSSAGEGNLKIKHSTVKAAIAPGENYGSIIYRVKATFQDGGERTFIVKILPPGEMGKMAKDCDIFRTEIVMFGNVVPEMEALLNAAAPGRYPALTARGLYQGDNPTEFLVLEDLAPQGFKLADRLKGLGLRHSLLALRALARYHAASVLVLERNPNVLDGLHNALVDGNEGFFTLIESSIQATADACRSWPGFEEYAPCLDKFKLHATATFSKLHKTKPGRFNVISHGDFWINNMLFRYENGEPQDIRLVDLQTSNVTSPALDIVYFLNNSLTEDVSMHHQDLLIREYHNALSEAMELLERKPPSLEELLEDIDTHGVFALFGSLLALPVIKARKCVDLGAMVTGDNSGTASLYQDPTVKRWLQRLIPEYKRRGWLPS